MGIYVKIFGQLSDITGKNELQFSNVRDTDQLLKELQDLYPSLKHVKYACAVDQKVIKSNTMLEENSIVALLPPFSGG
jgi:sulfur-carrier protein